jgi:hypothetical protein
VSWDGIYRAKIHHVANVDGRWITACGRRSVRRKTVKADARSVNCFACLKKLGIIK